MPVKSAEGFGAWVRGFAPDRKKEAEAKALNKNIYAASLRSGDEPPTGASDDYGPSVVALANENLNSPAAREYLQKLEESQAQAIDNQRAGIASAQGNLDMYNKLPVQYDLSPLMNLSDSWFGSNLAKGYKAPTTPEEMISARATLEGALNKSRMGLTEAEKDRLQQNLTNRQKTSQILNEAAIADAKRKELDATGKEKQDFKAEKMKMEMLAKYNKDYGEPIRGISQMRSAVQDAITILDRNGGRIPEYGSGDYNLYQSEITKAIVNYNRDIAMLGALSGPDKVLLDQIASNDDNIAKQALKEFAFKKDIRGVLGKIASDADVKVSTLKPQTEPYKKYIPDVYNASFGAYDAAKNGTIKQTPSTKNPSALLDSMKGL